MIHNFSELVETASIGEPLGLAVVAAHDKPVLEAVGICSDVGIVRPILIGNREMIEELASPDLLKVAEIIDARDDRSAAVAGVQSVREGKADILMKGLLQTSVIMSVALNKEKGLNTGRLLSHIAAVAIPERDHLTFITDGGLNIAPTLDEKVKIVKNAVDVAECLGYDPVKVALLSAVEQVSPKIPSTTDAAILAKMSDRGQFKGALVDGPFALDNAVSLEAAAHKGVKGPVAGNAQVFVVPELVSGNILYKSLTFITGVESAGMIYGASAPIVLTSRADTAQAKVNSISLCALIAKHRSV